MMNIFFKITLFSMVMSFMSCKTTSDSNNETSSRPERVQQNDDRQGRQQGGKGERPTAAQILAQMDANKDGKLSESEVKGPIKNDFSSIDTNSDGFISKEELEKAPKPERRGQGQPRQ